MPIGFTVCYRLLYLTEDLYRLVLQCVAAVPISSQQHMDRINEKSVKWVEVKCKTLSLLKLLFCHLFSKNGNVSKYIEVVRLSSY